VLSKEDIARAPNETLQEQVYRQLRQLLMTGHFRPGQALKIRDLAESFSTSIQPVREAIRQLIAEQALEASPNASTRVPHLNAEQLEDLRSVRVAVEGLAAERAISRMKKVDIDELLTAETAADDCFHVETSVARNLEFHFRLYSHSGSDILPAIIEGLWLRVGPSIRDAAEAFDARNGQDIAHHRDMIDALRKKDAAAVRAAVEQDINRFFAVLDSVRASEMTSTSPGPRSHAGGGQRSQEKIAPTGPARRGRPPKNVLL